MRGFGGGNEGLGGDANPNVDANPDTVNPEAKVPIPDSITHDGMIAETINADATLDR